MVQFPVPKNPDTQNDGHRSAFFPALQNWTTPGTGAPASILQPVLNWGTTYVYDNYTDKFVNLGGNYWFITAFVAFSGQYGAYFTGAEQVDIGDTIVGYMLQVASDPDEWFIEAQDYTTGAYGYLYIYPGGPKYNQFIPGALEAYGGSGQYGNPALEYCTDLPGPPDNYAEYFTVETVTQGGPNWNTANSVGSSLKWKTFGPTGPSGPNAPTYCYNTTSMNTVGLPQAVIEWLTY